MLGVAIEEGRKTLYDVCLSALKRWKANPKSWRLAPGLFAGDELDKLQESFAAVLATGDMIGRATVRQEFNAHLMKTFAESWDESEHPRDDDGKFVSKSDIAAAKGDASKAEALRLRVTNPEQRAKLDKAIGGKSASKYPSLTDENGNRISDADLDRAKVDADFRAELRMRMTSDNVKQFDRIVKEKPKPVTPEKVIKETKPATAEVKKSKAKVELFDKRLRKETDDAAQKLFKHADEQEIASYCGAPDDATVVLRPDKHGRLVANIEHDDFDMKVSFQKTKDGKTFMHLDEFFMKEGAQGKGIGTEVFRNQVANCRQGGLAFIDLHAAKENPGAPWEPHNGYYTWPRFGFDASIDKIAKDNPDIAKAIKEEYPKAKSILDVMKTKAGRNWWKENGDDLYSVEFDLSPKSLSMRVFSAYIEERAKGGKVTANADSNRPRQFSGPVEIELSPEDEEALERAWERVVQEDVDETTTFADDLADAIRKSGQVKVAKVPLAPLPPLKALEYFSSLVPGITQDPQTYSELMKRRAFTLAVSTDQHVLERVQEVIKESLAGGATEPIADIQEILDKAGVSPKNPQYAEAVYRTNTMSALNIGHEEERQDPDVIEAFPVWRWDDVGDERTRESHRERSGKYYPANVTFQTVRSDKPEEVINCRCVATAIYIDTWEGLQKQGAKVEASW